MKAGEFDKKFDAGEDVTGDLDVSGARRPRQEARRIQRAKNLQDSVAADTGALPLTVANGRSWIAALPTWSAIQGLVSPGGLFGRALSGAWIGWGEFAPGWSFDPRRRSSGRRQRTAS